MARSRTYSALLGARGGTSDLHLLSSYGVEAIVAVLMKIDAGTTGQVFGESYHVKPFTYDQLMGHTDVPSAAYLFLPPDSGATAHEYMHGTAVTIGGAGAGIGNAGGIFNTRYDKSWGLLPSNNSATDVGRAPLVVAEFNNQSWSWSGWLFHATAANNEFYIETNAGVTSFIQLVVTSGGQVTVTRTNGGVAGTIGAAGAIPASTWTHVGITWNQATTNLQLYINGVASGAAVAAARGTGYTSDRTIINRPAAAGAVLVALVANWQNVLLVADDFLRHYEDMTRQNYTGGFGNTPATIAKNSAAIVAFTNTTQFTFDTNTFTVTLPLAPMMGLGTLNGVFLAEITSYFAEVQ